MIRGGKSYVSSPPAFSNDAKKLLVCTASTVSIFSTSTGLLIGELEGHTARVTSVIVVPATTPANKILCYCWTASLDGTIRYWDYSVPELMKTIHIQSPIHSMVIPGLLCQPKEGKEKSSELFAYIYTEDVRQQKEQPKSISGHLQKCNLTKSRLSGGGTLAETKLPGPIIISPCGEYIAISEKRKLRIWEIPSKDSDRVSYKKIRLHHTKSFTAFAFHPSERIVAAGDVTGRILIWRGVGHKTFSGVNTVSKGGSTKDTEERPGVRGDDDTDSCTTWHWHSSQVNVLFFSSDGAYLYSGGKEGVLVVWQLDTGKKKFLPRIGSRLLYYISSPDPTLSSMSCADNRIHLLKMPSMEILRSISGIKPPCSVPEMYEGSSGGIVFDQSSALVAVCSENYCVQFYSLFNDREMSEVQICERNHQPGEDVTVAVSLVALSPDGSTLSTVESRLPEEGIGGLISLKFWASSPQSKSFILSTVIYEPHRDAGVSGIAFHPSRPMAVTSSYGADFRIWVRSNEIQRKDDMVENSGWKCHAVGSYRKKQMTAATFSADGSILAVAAETVITLWDPDRNILVAVIGDTQEPITTLSFVGKSEYLVSASQGSSPQVCLWSMSKLSLSWSYKLHAEAVTSSLDDASFAVLALLPMSFKQTESEETILQGVDGVILLFTVQSPVPLATWFVRKANGGRIGFIQATPKLEESSTNEKPTKELLAYMNSAHEYVLFDPRGQEAPESSVASREWAMGLEETGRFGYASIYGELSEFKLQRDEKSMVTAVALERPWETIFSGPSHTLPPLTKLCSVFMESLLEKRTTNVE